MARAARMTTEDIQRLIAEGVAAALAAQAQPNGTGPENAAGQGRRSCTYREFQQCKPLSFSGTEGVIGLTRWCEKMETVFRVSDCLEGNRVKYATCTLQDGALTWWNTYAHSVGIDVAHAITWEDLKQRLRDEYYPRNEIQKLEVEFWHLKTRGMEVPEYTLRFQELALLCPSMVTPEYKRIERYIWGLPPQIQGMVTSSEPTSIDSAIRMAHSLADQVKRRLNGEGSSGVQKGG